MSMRVIAPPSHLLKQLAGAHPRCGGFSLLELALVLAVLGVLGGLLLKPTLWMVDVRYRQQTAQQLQDAKLALIGHALLYHYLPCPDTDALPDGWENLNSNQNCSQAEGILPWRQLELPATDAWGRFLRYRVDGSFSDHKNWFGIAKAENASSIEIQSELGAVTSQSSRPAAVVLSHGKNGLGGLQWVGAGKVLALPAPTHPMELENADADVLYIDALPQQSEAGNVDDLLVILSPKVLISMLVSAQRLP